MFRGLGSPLRLKYLRNRNALTDPGDTQGVIGSE